MWSNPLACTYHRNFPESIRFPVVHHQTIDTTYQQVLTAIFKKSTDIITRQGNGIIGYMPIIGKIKPVKTIQSIFCSHPYKSAAILEKLVYQTAGQSVFCGIKIPCLSHQKRTWNKHYKCHGTSTYIPDKCFHISIRYYG